MQLQRLVLSRDGRWIAQCATTSRRPDSEIILFTAPGTPLAPRSTRTAPIWTTWKFTMNAKFYRIHVFPLSPAFICRNLWSAKRQPRLQVEFKERSYSSDGKFHY